MTDQQKRPSAKRHLSMLLTGTILLVAMLAAVVQQKWLDLVIPLVLVPTVVAPVVLEKWAGVRLPASIQAQYALLLIVGPFVGGQLDLYQQWAPWDTVVHFYSGFMVSFAAIFTLGVTVERYRLRLPMWLEAVLIIAVKALVALLWEIAEFFYDIAFDANAQDHNTDTMVDMTSGLIPGLLVAAALVEHRRSGRFRYIAALLNAPVWR